MPEGHFPHSLGRMEALLEQLIRQADRAATQAERAANLTDRMVKALELQVRMLDEDRKDTSSFRGRTREQLLELIEKNNASIGAVSKIAPAVDDLQRDYQKKDRDDAVADAEKRGAARMRALVLSIAGGVGAGLMWAISEVLKFFQHGPPSSHQ